MARPRNSYLFNLFKVKDQNQMVCHNGDCNGRKLCRHSANLERHLKNKHPNIYSTYMTKKKVIKFPWKANIERRLIKLVRGYPVLWDKSQNHSFSEGLAKKAWDEISDEMKTYSPLMRMEICKKKWNAIRKKFLLDCKKSPQPTSPDELDAEANQKGKYFSDLVFLRDKIISPPAENVEQNEPETITDMETILSECIKEESEETYLLDGENVEEITLQEESQISVNGAQEELELGDTGSDENDEESVEDTTLERNNNYKVIRLEKRPLSTHSDDEDDDDADTISEEHDHDQQKRKKPISLPEKENVESNNCEQDPDKMFLLSLLPFLKAVPGTRKLLVRHSLQGVLLEEEQQQQRQHKQNQQPHLPASNNMVLQYFPGKSS